MNASVLVLGIALPWLIVALFAALGAWIGFQLIQQNGRLLGRLEGLEQRLSQIAVPSPTEHPAPSSPHPAQAPEGLPLGSPAPAFELPDLAGTPKRLAEFRGTKLLVIFFNPHCGFCTRMVPDLAALPADGSGGKPIPLVVTTGDADENRALFAEHGVQCPVLLQKAGTHGVGGEVAGQYQCHGTPMGYLIDEQGRIASELAVGAPALLALAEGGAGSNGNGHAALGGTRTLAESKIQRDGLAVGTPAPPFTLPLLHGGELSLEGYRGRRILLVFSDPKCGPCDALAPQLEAAYRRSGDVQVLMVSRGDLEANQAKVAEQGLTFPIGLQRQWEISRDYAMFATPVAYWIDENGVIAAEVATGVDPILALLDRAAAALPARRCKCGKPPNECGQVHGDSGRPKARAASRGRNGS